MAQLKDNQLIIIDEEGNEIVCEIIFTFDSEATGKKYVIFQAVDDESGEVGAASYIEKDNGEGELEYVSSELIDEDGNVVFTFSHASDYVIVIGEERDAEEEIENPFEDVQEDQYYYKPVLWAVENGITAGLSATEFGPNETCTRAQIVTFLWRKSEK